MSIRIPSAGAVAVAALLAAGCTENVAQEESGSFVRAVLDSDRGLLPTPSDLALQAAPSIANTTIRAGLFGIIGNNGYVPDPTSSPLGPFSVVNIPYEVITDGVASTATGGAQIDPTTIETSTLAMVRLTGTPAVLDPLPISTLNVPGTTTAAIQILPRSAPGASTPTGWAPGRYVVAMRGGPNGVRTVDGQQVRASTPIFLVTQPEVQLGNPEGRPASVSEEDAATLQRLQQSFQFPIDWDPVLNGTVCRTALGIPAGAPFPEARCWLPNQAPTPPPTLNPAFGVLDALAWPHEEAASIQTFEVAAGADVIP